MFIHIKLLISTLELTGCQDNYSRLSWTKCTLKLDSSFEYTNFNGSSNSTTHIYSCSVHVEIEDNLSYWCILHYKVLSWPLKWRWNMICWWTEQPKATNPERAFWNAIGLSHTCRINLLFCNIDMLFSLHSI